MLDIKKIKENPDAVKAGLRAKEVDCDATVEPHSGAGRKDPHSEDQHRDPDCPEKQAGEGKRQALRHEEESREGSKDVSELDAAIAANNAQSVQIAERSSRSWPS